MPNVKISQLNAAGRNVNATDLFEIQDPIDLSQGPSGTSKYLTGAEILASVPPPTPINAISPMAYNGLNGNLSVNLSASAPIVYNVGAFSFSYNISNLQLTANELNTIQDITTSSIPTFSNIVFSNVVANPGSYVAVFNSDKTIGASTNFRYSSGVNSFHVGVTHTITGTNNAAIAGQNHVVSGNRSVCLGGSTNTSSGTNSVVVGGQLSTVSSGNSGVFASLSSSASNGLNNGIYSCDLSTISGSSPDRSVIIGSSSCTITSAANASTLGSTSSGNASPRGAIIASSSSTNGNGNSQVIIGSDQCSIGNASDYSSIFSSALSTINTNCDNSVILGGTSNQIGIGSNYSAILYGSSNNVTGTRSAAAGHRAKALNNGTFIIQCDNTAISDFTSSIDGTFCVNTLNGIGLQTASPNSAISLGGTLSFKILTTAVSAATSTLKCNIIACTAGSITITLSTTDLVIGRSYIIKDESGTATNFPITIVPEAPASLIDGQPSITISVNYGCANIYSNGTNWFTI